MNINIFLILLLQCIVEAINHIPLPKGKLVLPKRGPSRPLAEKFVPNMLFDSVSKQLYKEVSIFCVIASTPKYKESRTIPQIRTWVKRCNNYLVASSKEDKSIRAIKAYKQDSYKYVWAKTKTAFMHIYKKYGTTYDWIIKCDDDSYVVLENLRMFLLNKDPNTQHYYGFRLQFYEPHTNGNFDYIQGGSCFVISKATLKTLVTRGLSNPKVCKKGSEGHDDREIGECLRKLQVKPVDVRDMHDQIMFVPSSSDEFATTDYNMNQAIFKAFNKVIIRDGKEGLSEYPIAFHYIEGKMQYGLEYMFYKAQVIGLQQSLFRESCIGNCFNQTQAVMDKIKNFSDKYSKHD